MKISSIGGEKHEKNISFAKVARILNEDGKDVTADRLGKYYRGPQAPTAKDSKVSNVARPSSNDTSDDPKAADTSLAKTRDASPAESEPDTATARPPDTTASESEAKAQTDTSGDSSKTASRASDTTASTATTNTSPESWLSKSDKAIKEYERKPWNAAIRVAGNFGIPTGDYYEGITSGAGFEADLIFPLTYNAALRFSVSRSGIDWEGNLKSSRTSDGTFVFDLENKIEATRISVAGQYYHQPRRDGVATGPIAYFYSGLGAIVHKLSSTATAEEIATGITATSSASVTETKFMLAFGGGITTLLSPKVGLDFGSRLDLVYIDSNRASGFFGGSEAQYALIFDLNVGFVLLL